MARKPPDLIDPRLLKALVHPTRIHIMDILTEGENSPSGIQKRIGDISLDLVSHHIKVLRDLGVVELCDEVKQKGKFTEHIYRARDWQYLNDEEWGAIDPGDRPGASMTILRGISEDVTRALWENRIDERVDSHLSRSPLKLDEQAWKKVAETLESAMNIAMQAHKESLERANRGETDLIDARVVIMYFPLDDLEESGA
jgi:DNA-binding transcriptional ArsR family regulator